MKLHDEVWIVTGSTMGIGEAIARAAVAEGARVLIHGLEPEEGARVVETLGESAAVHIEDLADPGAGERVVAEAVASFGRLDGLVNNAAAVLRGTVNTTDVALWDRCMAVNVRAPFFLIQAARPYLRERQGTVLNISSVNGHCGEETFVPYSVSKGALQTLTRNLGDSLLRDDGIRVNQINPGWILTPGEKARKEAEGLPADWPSRMPTQFVPSGRLITPEEIASTAVHMMSKDFGPISGAVIDLEQYPMIGRNPVKEDVRTG